MATLEELREETTKQIQVVTETVGRIQASIQAQQQQLNEQVQYLLHLRGKLEGIEEGMACGSNETQEAAARSTSKNGRVSGGSVTGLPD